VAAGFVAIWFRSVWSWSPIFPENLPLMAPIELAGRMAAKAAAVNVD